MLPLISIIVPVYNVEHYLPRCIDSILAQTYSNLEIILVNDGSSDDSGHICDLYAERDSRIHVIHKQNGGVSSARNTALEVYSGEYLMFVDSDDYISESAVEELYKRILSDGSDMAVGKHVDIDEDGNINDSFCNWMKDAVLSKEEIFNQLGEKSHVTEVLWAKIYKRTIFEGILFPALKCGEDLWAYPLILDRCKKISIVDQVIYFYFQRSNSIVHAKSEQTKLDDIIAVLHLTQFLFENNFLKSASRWYSIGIDKSLDLEKKPDGLSLFRQYFSKAERKKLIQLQGSKTKLKWLCLYVPFLHIAVKSIKNYIRWIIPRRT